LAAPSAAGAAPDLSSGWGQTARYGWPVAAPASKKRAHETEAQMRRRKKKNQKNRERQERKAAGLKINSPDDVPTFEEFDSADPSEVNFSTSQPFFCFTYHFFLHIWGCWQRKQGIMVMVSQSGHGSERLPSASIVA
jgi:hypothetical protein